VVTFFPLKYERYFSFLILKRLVFHSSIEKASLVLDFLE
jgi:hypothetical protein